MNKWIVMLLAAAIMLTFSGLTTVEAAQASTVLTKGSVSGDVWDLQYRLNALGYYSLPLDGKYGPKTEAAVRSFQRDFGIQVDGKVGAQSWKVLKKVSLNRSEMDILARTIYSEARGESYVGQVAVGAVVMNRIASSQFPDTIRGVVFQSRAFTSVSDGQFWLTPNSTAYKAAYDAVRGWDPSKGALYYFNPKTSTSKWIWSRKVIIQIGRHIFAT
ncbi:MAG: spore cortex-lytic enzyme [Paenibacillaceae bacterium]|jgi:N-acetylmuramoyl-L-alanine amidase|nr:spore cortex-lytic enzyme [Paenibacillaceae bacterium]